MELINEILDLALIESGRLSLSHEPIELSEILFECQAMIGPQALKRGITVQFPRLEVPHYVSADRTRVKQVLINLLSNSIKYNKFEGSVRVTCEETTAGRVRIEVQDTGNGLPQDKLEQLFQPFNRLGQEGTSEEGTGIGLVVCKRLIELMRGEIGVRSTVGTGSVFWIELCRSDLPETLAAMQLRQTITLVESLPTLENSARLSTLLYVEDNSANLMLVEDLIERRSDIRLITARDGPTGIEIARREFPDAILMDINLPGISGLQALRILALDPSTAHIPVVALSANAMPSDIERGMQSGFFDYLTKPIKVAELMGALDRALSLAKSRSVSLP